MLQKDMSKVFLLAFLFFFLFVIQLSGQKTNIHNTPESIYRQGIDLYQKQLYSAAYEKFRQVTELVHDRESLVFSESRLYMALCSYELLNNDAIYQFEAFISEFSDNSGRQLAVYSLGNIHFREKRYKKAIEKYSVVDIVLLDEKYKSEYYFKYGYSAFMLGDNETAKKNFTEIKDLTDVYSAHALYYFAHICYEEKNFSTAIAHFRRLVEHEDYMSIVPYYITQILYFQKKYEELIEFAEPFVSKASTTRLPEISRLLGESYFNLKKYAQAVKWLEKYKNTTKDKLTPEFYYKIGYAYYSIKNYENAVSSFQNSTTGSLKMTQNAHYHMADCYIRLNNKPLARSEFLLAYKAGHDPIITEDAMFQFAKLSYELSIDPYNEAIKVLQEYINAYPDNIRTDEAYEYLISLYMQTKNYSDALASIEKIKFATERINTVYQKLAYYGGVEFYNNRNYKEAIILFNKSLLYPYDRILRSQALFWKGESYYRMNNYDSALVCYERFLLSPGSVGSYHYPLAYYNIGYIHYSNKRYSDALTAFRTFQTRYRKKDDALLYDVYIRTGDCFFSLRRFVEAEVQYTKSIMPNVQNADYALLQRAKARGAQGNFNGKISDLQLFIKDYQRSPYLVEVIYELGETYNITERYNEAISTYRIIADKHPRSLYRIKALLKLGMLYNYIGQNEQALVELKKIPEQYPVSEESKEALILIRNIYTEMNKIEDFFTFVKDYGETITTTEQDSLTYVSAENLYFKGEWGAASRSFEKYIKTFPDGAFILKSHFYKAECDYQLQKFDAALEGYEYVAQKPWTPFTEKSLLMAANIHFNQQNYKKAAQLYSSLEQKAEKQENIFIARQGMMKSYFRTNQYQQAMVSAQKVTEITNLSNESINEAKSIMGISAYNLNDFIKAQQIFDEQKYLKNEYAAQAYYYLALINYNIKKYEESEKLIFQLINKLPSHEYWIAKAFLLLADNYVATQRYYQAKYTLRSVIDNYQGVDLVMEAQRKLAEIEKIEEKETQSDSENNLNE